jgi:hypothetical protein
MNQTPKLDCVFHSGDGNEPFRATIPASNISICVSKLSEDRKVADFTIGCSGKAIGALRLTAVKGSFFTTLWNIHARVDDQYTLEYTATDTIANAHSSKFLWRVKGVDAYNQKITSSHVDWNNLRELQRELNLQIVGVLAFTEVLGQLLLILPSFHDSGRLQAPMPAAFM